MKRVVAGDNSVEANQTLRPKLRMFMPHSGFLVYTTSVRHGLREVQYTLNCTTVFVLVFLMSRTCIGALKKVYIPVAKSYRHVQRVG